MTTAPENHPPTIQPYKNQRLRLFQVIPAMMIELNK